MRAERLYDMTGPAIFGMQFNGLEVCHVLWVEEHESNGGYGPMDLERVTGEDDSLGNDTFRVRIEKCTHCDKMRRCSMC